ncbi:MAG: DUF5121 domain-containing protein [Bacteroidaceae bacterium]|nr:DUF5121 domain-containing protein [Bacteroidaceae bacterium]
MNKIVFLSLCACILNALPAASQYYKSYTTTADGSKLMAYETGPSRSSGGTVVTLQPTTMYQTVDGFGYAITYSACYNLMQMHPRDRHAFLRRTFSRETGYGVSYVRMSIGCSDFSSTEYTLCDTKGLENFRLHSDEVNYVVPVLQEILSINPDLKIIGSPWTCPRWMKVESLSNLTPKNSWTSGQLNPSYYADYARYFVKFVEAMRDLGIPIYAVTPQNEPLNRGNSASLYMPWEDEAAFLKHLAPAFKRAGLSTKIYVFDHNYNYDNVSSQTDYPINVYNALSGNMEGSELVVGSAWHNYGGSVSELDDIRGKAPKKEMIFTEASIGTWNNGRSLSARLMDDMNGMVLACVNRYCRAVIVWNLMLDLKRGPNRTGGCTTCYGAVDIDDSDYHTISANSHYYVINHISAVAQPGATRIGTRNSVSGITMACFANPDGTYGAVATNSGSSDKKITVIATGVGFASVNVPAKGVVSVLLSKENPEPELRIDTMQMVRTGVGRYSLTLDMTQGSSHPTNFLAGHLSDWFLDSDFISVDADGAISLQALSGTYTLEADLNERSLTVTPKYEKLDASGQGNLYIIGASSSVGRPFYIGGTDWRTDRAIPMAEVSDRVYQATLTVGQQMAASGVTFGIYGSNEEWTPQFMGRAGSDYRLSCSSLYFGIGTGSFGTTNGNVYQRSGGKLTEGDIYRFTVDLTAGVNAGVLTVTKVDPSGIGPSPSAAGKTSEGNTYDLQGIPVKDTQKGNIYINEHRKVLINK